MGECAGNGSRCADHDGNCVLHVKTYRCIPVRRSLCAEHGREYQAVSRGTDPAVKHSVRLCDRFCRTNILCGNRSATHCQKPAQNSQTSPCDPCVFPWRSSILPFLRSDSQNCICAYRTQYQLRNCSVRSTGRNLYYDSQTAENITCWQNVLPSPKAIFNGF